MTSLCVGLLAVPLASFAMQASAVSFWNNQITDDSVCDLSPSTSVRISQKIAVPAGSDVSDAADAYFRVAATFVVSKCSNRQVLILHGRNELPFDAVYLRDLANSACTAATVQQSPLNISWMNREIPGFQLKCVISKHSTLKATLVEREKKEPLPALLSRIQQRHATTVQTNGSNRDGSGRAQRDCGKLSLGTLLFGGATDGCN